MVPPAQPDSSGEPPVVPLVEPRDGVPPVVTCEAGLAATAAAFAAGHGPVAVDAERASGYRYGQRAYLVQIRRDGAGTALLDPVAVPDLSALSAALSATEWVLHAASQDLPCLADVGMVPDQVFDTELAARLLGYERVGLAAVVAQVLGLGLAKEHSAVDWSTRPLPDDWLRYAALDVEVLVEVRHTMAAELDAAGKTQWAAQEFEAVRTAPPPPPRPDPWRRVSGLHAVKGRRNLAVVRELWTVRDAQGQARDLAPGRVLPDRAIIAAALALPRTVDELRTLPVFSGRRTSRRAELWQVAVDRALGLRDDELPPVHGPKSDGPPPVRGWRDRDPDAAARITAARAGVAALATMHNVPAENVVAPDLIRRLCWSPPSPATPDAVAEALAAGGARPWQVELTTPVLADALGRRRT
ncbi:MAG: HRDC domain-containing protein [Micrococcales bacterium]|nr:HRDC domain-containing protein [Micrococcales bacterium]